MKIRIVKIWMKFRQLLDEIYMKLGWNQDNSQIILDVILKTFLWILGDIFDKISSTMAEWSRWTYPALSGAGGVGSIPANSDAQNVHSFRRWRFEMKLSPFFILTKCRWNLDDI